MPVPIQLTVAADFTGGLNLNGDQFQLQPNESPAMLNVDVDPLGGFRLRDGIGVWGDAPGGAPIAAFPFLNDAGTRQLIVQSTDATNPVKWSTGSTWTSVAIPTSGSLPLSAAMLKNRMYFVNTGGNTQRWDGTTRTSMSPPVAGVSYNNDYSNPTIPPANGKVPQAALVAAHGGCLFVANTTEGGTNYPCRVRWSQPNFPEDWVDYAYIDVDPGHDGDSITALVPFSDHLLVFKTRSIHAIYGSAPESFQIVPVSRTVGAPSASAVLATEEGLFFFDEKDGIYRYTGQGPEWLGRRVHEAMMDGTIDTSQLQSVALGFYRHRLWVSVPLSGGKRHTYVLDTRVGKEGCWTVYDLWLNGFVSLPSTGAPPEELALTFVGVAKLHQPAAFDTVQAFGISHIDSYYETRWFDQNAPAVRKRWRRPEVVARADTSATVTVDVFRDYDSSLPHSCGSFTGEALGTYFVWDVSNWDEALWARDPGTVNKIQRLGSLGNARAVALRFNGPLDNEPWGVDALTFKFQPRKVRS